MNRISPVKWYGFNVLVVIVFFMKISDAYYSGLSRTADNRISHLVCAIKTIGQDRIIPRQLQLCYNAPHR